MKNEKKITREEFKTLLKELNPALATYWSAGLDLPRATWDTAAYCFIHKINHKGTKEVRRQLLELNKKGLFDFKDE